MAQASAAARVLVVDDDEGVRTFVVRALQESGYDAVSATGGREALQVVGEQPGFDLYVLDVMMPDMTGDELGRHLRARDPDARILYFTGYADRLFAERTALGAHEAFLDKPVTMTGLREAVSLLLFGRTSRS
ncbi:MAG TPA: response regulator [Vicinamibacterales bacterium]|nr:response regulator [Vicinamibacterales bacterium]